MKRALTLFQRRPHSVVPMRGRFPVLACLALTGALALATPALPQDVIAPCRLCSADGQVVAEQPKEPVRLEVEASLDFDRLVTTGAGAGSAELGPDGARMVRGTVAAMSPRAMVGEVLVRGEPGREVRIELPRSIELAGFNGGSIRIESLRSDLPPAPRLDSNGRLSFRFGGTIHVSGDADGDFRGDARIEVDYF